MQFNLYGELTSIKIYNEQIWFKDSTNNIGADTNTWTQVTVC